MEELSFLEVLEGENSPAPMQELKNAKKSQIMGIISLICACLCCCGMLTPIFGFLSYSWGKKAVNIYESNPELYTEKSYKQAKTGKITGLIAGILGSIGFVLSIVYYLVYGMAALVAIANQ